jgi:hypothetical protein
MALLRGVGGTTPLFDDGSRVHMSKTMRGGRAMEVRINHVAMSMPLDESTRSDIHGFYGEVFGWTPYSPPQEMGNPLVMLMSDPHVFLFIVDAKEGMVAPPLDHFGIEVFDEDELDEMLGRAKTYRDKDNRVRIIEKKVERHTADAGARSDSPKTPGADLVNCYIGYLLPMMVEIQHFRAN